jgi:hypothetical protein
MSLATFLCSVLAGGTFAALVLWKDGFVAHNRGRWATSQWRPVRWLGWACQRKPLDCPPCLPCWAILIFMVALDWRFLYRDLPLLAALGTWLGGCGLYFVSAIVAANTANAFGPSSLFGHKLYELITFAFPILSEDDVIEVGQSADEPDDHLPPQEESA